MKISDRSFNYISKSLIKAIFRKIEEDDDIFSGQLNLDNETFNELQKIAKEYDPKFKTTELLGKLTDFYIDFGYESGAKIGITMVGDPAPYGDEEVEYRDGKAYYGFGVTGEWNISFSKEIEFNAESW